MAPSSSSSSSSMSVSQTVTQLLKQTSHYDKDERYMATSDLCALLKKPPPPHIHPSSSNSNRNSNSNSGSHYPQQPQYYHPIELKLEKEICTTVLRLLHDKSNDVQAIAVKTLGVLITTMTNTDILIEISNSLLDQIMDATKMELRDIYTAGLRTVVQTCDTPMGIRVTPTLIPRLLDVLRIGPPNVHPTTTTTATTTTPSSSPSPSPQMEEMMVSACDVLMDCIVRFGTSVIQSHETILQVCLDLLLRSSSSSSSSGSSRNSSGSHSTSNPTSITTTTSSSSTMMVRKRTGNVLACLATVLNDTLLHQLIEALLHPIEASQQEPPPSSHTSHSTSNSNYNHNADMTRTLIRTMCSISGSVGQRFQQYHIDRIIPIFLPFTDPNQAITGDDDDDDHDDHPAHSNSNHSHPNQNNTGLVMNELREACFIGYTSFIVSCPQEMEHHLPSIIVAALAYMRYDPNYSYGNDNTAMEDDDNNDDQDGDDGDDDEYEDEYDNENDDDEDDEDDDESWKVRRSAIRTIKAIVEMKFPNTSAYHSHMGAVWTNPYSIKQQLPAQTISQALMERFMEREENCRVDIMDCFTKLLSTTIQLVASGESTTNVSGSGGILNSSSSSSHALQFSKCSDNDDVVAMETTDTTKSSSNNCTITIIPISTEYAPVLVKSCAMMLSKFKKTSGNGHNTNDRSKSAALNLLSTLCTVPGSGIGSYNEIQIILQQIQLLLGGGNAGTATTSSTTTTTNSHTVSKAIRLDALSLLHTMLASDTHNPVDIRRSFTEPFVQQLCSVVVQEQWYKVIAEALRVMSYIPRYFVVTGVQSALPEEPERTTVVAKELYVAIEPLLAAHDVDSEIKEGALRACAALLQYLPSHLTNEQTVRLLQLLYDRLTNETTRIAAMKAYAMIAEPLPSSTMAGAVGGSGGGACQLHSILDDSISTMASFLKLQNRGLKQSSLETLNVIISNHGSNVTNPNELYPTVVQALASLISDRDLHLCHLSLYV